MFKLLSALVLVLGCSAASLKVLPVVDSSLPVEFEKKEIQEAPALENLAGGYAYAVDISGPTMPGQLTCLKKEGYQAVFVRVYNPVGSGYFDTNSVPTIQNAYSAGLGIEVFVTPQPKSSKSGSQQFDEAYQGLTSRGINVRTIWLQVTSPSNWMLLNDNMVFINSFVSRAKQYNLQVGIYTSYYDWAQITNSWANVGSDVQLWYWLVYGGGISGESSPDFTDFRPFGSWSTPSIKQFGLSETLCSLVVNRNAYYSSSAAKMDNSGVPVAGFIKTK